MCGIAGIFLADGGPPPLGDVKAMVAGIAHRGPDGEGFWQGPGIALGHRRLAIIDLPGGAQPMATTEGDWAIVFNGEIYNYRELRTELSATGRQFKTSGDTEVVLAAYERWGSDAPIHLRGMFAIAAWHQPSQTLHLCRDQLGIKPLVYSWDQGRLTFASELQALKRLPYINRQVDMQAIGAFLRWQYIPWPATAYRSIRKLPPGCRLELHHGQDFTPEPIRWWQPTWQTADNIPVEAWHERIRSTVDESIRCHLLADVPFGAFLSGGIDSSLVTARMAKVLGRPPETFTIGFDDPTCDESSWADEASQIIGTSHHHLRVGIDAIDLLPQLVRHYGEPFGDASAMPTWHVCALARSKVTMALSGDGGDELFAGYATYSAWVRWLSGEGSAPPRRALRWLLSKLAPHRWQPREPTQSAWFNLVAWTPLPQWQRLWPKNQIPALPLPDSYPDLPRDPLALAQALDLGQYLPSCILNKVDIASMAHGLEVRTPLTDVRVLDLALRIPTHLRAPQRDGVFHGKDLLRHVAEAELRPGFFNRPKQGFAAPLQRWLVDSKSGSAAVWARLHGNGTAISQLLDPRAIEAVLLDKHAGRIWLLLVLDEWLRQERG